MPGDLFVRGQHSVLPSGGADVPRSPGVVDERSVTTPAEGVVVLVGLAGVEEPAGFEVVHDAGVGVLDEHAHPRRDLGREAGLFVHGHDHGQVVGLAYEHVVGAEGRRDVDDAGALIGGDKVGRDDPPGRLVGRNEAVGGLVAAPDQLGARKGLLDGGVGAEDRCDQVGSQDKMLLTQPDAGVEDVGTHGGGDVGDERPRRGGPHQEAHGPAVRGQFGRRGRGRRDIPSGDRGAGRCWRRRQKRETHEDRGVGHQLVSRSHLVRRQSRPAARAVRHYLVALVQQPFLGELRQDPPHRLDVAVGHGHIRVVEVEPHADALGHAVPVVHVSGHRLAAKAVELGHAISLDLLLVVEAQPLLQLQLHRQTVAVPAGLAAYVVAAHGLVARVDVLEDPGEDVVHPRLAVGRRGPLEKHPFGIPGPQREALLEDGTLFPPTQHPLLESGEALSRVDRSIPACHAFLLSAPRPTTKSPAPRLRFRRAFAGRLPVPPAWDCRRRRIPRVVSVSRRPWSRNRSA